MGKTVDTERVNEIRQDILTVKTHLAKIKGKRGVRLEREAYQNLLAILVAWEKASI